MASYSPNAPEARVSEPYQDDLIDFRPFIDTLLKWWLEIFLLTLVAALIGIGLAYYQHHKTPPFYEASAQVAVARIVSNVDFDNTIKTTVSVIGSQTQDSYARRNSLLGLVQNGTIANEVLEELGPMVKGYTPDALMGTISAAFVGDPVSDLIKITAVADTPEKAAAIANSWAKHYVSNVNALYGEVPTDMTEEVGIELKKAETNYETAQKAYEDFLSTDAIPTLTREIAEKKQFINTLESSRQIGLQTVITQTLNYRQHVITTYQTAIQENQLLALKGEQDANRSLAQSLIQAIGDNRQLAFSKDHNARVQLFTQYADLELQNRLLAMQQEQDAKTQIFKAYSDADLKTKLAVFNQQVDDKVGALVSSYATKQRIDQLLDEAKALQKQIAQAGDAGANSNSLPLLLLKIEAYAATATNKEAGSNGPIQYDLSGSQGLAGDSKSQATDIAVLISTLTERSNELGERIKDQSQTLANNQGYQLLSGTRPEDDALYAAMQDQYLRLFQVDGLAQEANGMDANVSTVANSGITNTSIAAATAMNSAPVDANTPNDQAFSQQILAKYDELFGLGSVANASLNMTDTTPIYAALKSQYPSLFNVGNMTQLGDLLAGDSALDSASQKKLVEMLQPSDELESYLAAVDVGSQPIQKLEDEVRTLTTTLEAGQAKYDRFVRERDMALQAYNTLNSKLLELTLQRTVANREVRFAAAANSPDAPIPHTSSVLIALVFGMVGFVVAVGIALIAGYRQVQPFILSRLRHTPAISATPAPH
jgi:capsular polysaccharide biosynthesis protein